jgi:tetratricopeptide (TPR) repeat protein
VALLLVSAAIRLFFYLQVRDTDLAAVPLLDSETYRDWALDLIAGDWGWNETYWMGPLYPHFLALVYLAFGTQGQAALIIQLGLSLLNVWLVYQLVMRLGTLDAAAKGTPALGGGAALLAAALFAFYGAPVFYAGNLLMATMATTLFLVAALRTVDALERPTWRNWALLGAAVGLAGLTRGNMLIMLATLPLLAWKFIPGTGGVRLRAAGVMVAAGLLVLAPATLRNIIVADDFVLLTSNGGVNLLIGQQHQYQGIFAPVMDEAQAEYDPSLESKLERELGRDLKGSEVSRILTRRAWTAFRDNLGAMPLHYLRKAYRFWNGYELPQIVSYDYYHRQFLSLRLLPVPFVLLSALGLVGLRFLPVRARWVVGAFLLAYFLSLLPFFPTSRYRQPIAPFLAVAAAAYVVAMARGAADRKVWLPVGVVMILLLLPRWASQDQAEVLWPVHLHEASRASTRGDLDRTLACGRRAEAVRPGLPDTPYHLALYLEDLGAIEESLAALRTAEERAPGNRLVPYRRGRHLEEAGRLAEALAAYERAAAISPQWDYPWLRIGLVLHRQGHLAEAVTAMEEAYRLGPGSRRIRANLASLCAEAGRFDQARALLAELTRDYPLYVNGWFNLAVLELQAGRPEQARAALARASALKGLDRDQTEQIKQLEQVLVEAGYR